MAFSEREVARLVEAAGLIAQAEQPLGVIRATSWPPEVTSHFFARGAKELPAIDYRRPDFSAVRERLAAARALISGESPVHRWLARLAEVMEATAAMLGAIGTAGFTPHSITLYGEPKSRLSDGRLRTLDLAERLNALLADYGEADLSPGAVPTYSAEELKQRFQATLAGYFGAEAPRIEISSHLSAKATASRDLIRLRAGARFSDLDATQLLQHEAFVHIATGINGRAQAYFPILGEAHPGNTRTQEGLAVFAEFISGALDPKRLRRLADRVLAIEMSLNGANFLDLYAFFRDRSETEIEAFENARRVVRGGLVTGGAPFTKDVVYLEGLIEVHSFLRTAVRHADPSLIRLLFAGKFDLSDIEAMVALREAGLIAEPRFLAPWARDLRQVVSYLAYSVFLNEVDLSAVYARYAFLFDRTAHDKD